jgi:hypothetical protein
MQYFFSIFYEDVMKKFYSILITIFYLAYLVNNANCQFSCDISASPNSGLAALSVRFTPSYSSFYCSSIRWSFGDGSTQSSGTSSVYHTYNKPGLYRVSAVFDLAEGTCSVTGYPIVVNATDIDNNITTPNQFLSVYPNPAYNTTEIQYNIEKPGKITLSIYNNLGIEVKRLLNEAIVDQCSDKIAIDTSELPSGVYLCSIKSGNYSETVKLIVIK